METTELYDHAGATATPPARIPSPREIARHITGKEPAAGFDKLPHWESEEERLELFGKAIDEIRNRVEAQIGDEDVAYIKKVDAFSRAMEVVGRVLIHFSIEPVTFSAGVLALAIYKILQSMEVGHTALHQAFDGLEGAERFQSKTFKWEPPIDEEAWHKGHNVGHHQYTNIVGKDPDVRYGNVRLNPGVEWSEKNEHQIAQSLFSWVFFGTAMNLHFTGVEDLALGRTPEDSAMLKDRSEPKVRKAFKQLLRKYARHAAKEYVLFPALAGPFFWKVALGNFISSRMRDVYAAATIYCGHIGDDVADYPEGTKAKGRGQWYAMQAEAANNFEVPLPVSILCGALDYQIEHHLFPKFPTNRLREIAPEIRAVCEQYGVNYNTDTWPNTLKKAFRRLEELSHPNPEASIEIAPTREAA
ncbi:MAG: fatty acid desaturase [Chrysiogenetes bacterium]|nr:fatty acid desaturase [Chrysiogenetes bacterium]